MPAAHFAVVLTLPILMRPAQLSAGTCWPLNPTSLLLPAPQPKQPTQVLNFSIAYGKTAHGLSKDWKVSLDEAKETVKRWYADRPEVRRQGRGQCGAVAMNGGIAS